MEWWEDKAMPRSLGLIACASLVGGAVLSCLQRAWSPILYVLDAILTAGAIMALMSAINALLFIPVLKLMVHSRRRRGGKPQNQEKSSMENDQEP